MVLNMKQNITIEQLLQADSLLLSKLYNLIHWKETIENITYNTEWFDFCKTVKDCHTYRTYLENIIKNINIGNMIEVLCNSGFGFPRIGLTESRKISELIVPSVTCLNGSKHHGKEFEADTLCDALWKAVVFILSEVEIEEE